MMKFNEMSWKELKKDFKKILDNMTTEELVDSIKKYAIDNKSYSFEISYEDNLNENIIQEDINIIMDKNEIKQEKMLGIVRESFVIDSEQYLKMEDAA